METWKEFWRLIMYKSKQKHRLILIVALILAGFLVSANDTIAQENVRFDSAMVPMSDDVLLSTDIYLPLEEGKYSVVLVRTPYSARRRYYLGI
jgi:predicted acyl esterase